MLEATKRGMARDLLLAKKIRRSARFCRVRIFLDYTEKPDPKQVYRRACRKYQRAVNLEKGIQWYMMPRPGNIPTILLIFEAI